MTEFPSHCPLDCPDACSLVVTVEDGRVAAIDGGRANPVTEGYICAKVRKLPLALYGPDRLSRPLRRAGRKGRGEFTPVTWDDALEEIARRLAEARDRWGGETILPLYYGGSNGMLSQDTLDARLFRRLGASRLARTVCASATGRAAEGLTGKMAGVAYADYACARFVAIWGANPSASGFHLVKPVREAQRAGAFLAVVDPRRTPLAAQADLHLAIRPGTDLPLALATARWLFHNGGVDEAFVAAHVTGAETFRERTEPWTPGSAAAACGVPAADIERFARAYRDRAPAVIRCGWGLERNRNGGSAVAAVLALPSVAGKFGVRGGGYTLSNSAAWGFSTESAIGAAAPPTRVINMNLVGRALLEERDPAIHALFVYNHNPVATLPRQDLVRRGFLREDLFTVVFDHFLTDTARYADIVLPAAAFPERREFSRGYGGYALQDSPAVAAQFGESRSNHEVFGALLTRLGLDEAEDPLTEEAVVRAVLGAHPDGGRLAAELETRGAAVPAFGDRPVQFVDVHPRTPDGKIHLVPEALDREAPEGLYAYRPDPATERHPLVLISPASAKTVSSTLAHLHPDLGRLALHPRDAAERAIAAGDPVRVHNEFGEVRCRAVVSEEVPPGIVSLPKGLWDRHTENGATANALVPDTLTDLGAGACFNDARVQVERVESGPRGGGSAR